MPILPLSILRLPFLYTPDTFQAWFLVAVGMFLAFLLLAQYRPRGKAPLWKRWLGGSRTGAGRLVLWSGALATVAALCEFAANVWLTCLFSPPGFEVVREIAGIEESSKKYDLYFDDGTLLRLGRRHYRYEGWQVGDRLCLVGRTWWMGTVVDDLRRDVDGCKQRSR